VPSDTLGESPKNRSGRIGVGRMGGDGGFVGKGPLEGCKETVDWSPVVSIWKGSGSHLVPETVCLRFSVVFLSSPPRQMPG
jgi:hypothetical protein